MPLLAALLLVATAWCGARAAGLVGPGAARRRLRPPGSAAPGASAAITELGRRWRERPAATQRAIVEGLPAALDAVGRALRSGASLAQALDEPSRAGPSPAAASLSSVGRAAARGVPLRDACLAWGQPGAPVEVRLTASALALAATAGGRPALAVEGVSQSLRERVALRREAAAQSAQARLSALVIGLLPLAFTGWCVLTDPRVARFLLASRTGWACLASGLALQAAGITWMARLVRGVE